MPDVEQEKPARAPVLDPIERATEVIFGLLMAMAFIGSLSVETAGRKEEREMMAAALGCNLAWGLADAVMYLVSLVIERTRNRTLLARLHGGADATVGQALIAEALPRGLAAGLGAEGLEALRQRLLRLPRLPAGPRLRRDDFRGALGVFLLVVVATFPVVVPFIMLDRADLAVRVSQLAALAMLFLAGWTLGRYAGSNSWWAGIAMAATGTVLLAVIIALGG